MQLYEKDIHEMVLDGVGIIVERQVKRSFRVMTMSIFRQKQNDTLNTTAVMICPENMLFSDHFDDDT